MHPSRLHRGYLWRSLAVQKSFLRGGDFGSSLHTQSVNAIVKSYWGHWFQSPSNQDMFCPSSWCGTEVGLPCFWIIFSYVRRAKKSQLEPAENRIRVSWQEYVSTAFAIFVNVSRGISWDDDMERTVHYLYEISNCHRTNTEASANSFWLKNGILQNDFPYSSIPPPNRLLHQPSSV